MRPSVVYLFAALIVTMSSRGPAVAETGPVATGTYPLDAISRDMAAADTPAPCSSRGLVRYTGELIPYARPAQVHPAFRDRLRRMEQLMVNTALTFYGRAPRRLLHLGTFNCRRIRAYPDLVSEHALGNAIDVSGFEFGAMRRGDIVPPDAPRGAFSVHLESDWNADRPVRRVHREFLRELARRVIEEPDLFRVALGPAWPGHRNHFHFDCAPYRLVAVF